jgi:hypothetical protein
MEAVGAAHRGFGLVVLSFMWDRRVLRVAAVVPVLVRQPHLIHCILQRCNVVRIILCACVIGTALFRDSRGALLQLFLNRFEA